MWKLLSNQQQPQSQQPPPTYVAEPTPDLRAQLQPFQGCSPQQIQEQLQALHIQGDPTSVVPTAVVTQQAQADIENSLTSSSGVYSESGHVSTSCSASGSTSSVASSSRKSSTGSSLMALLSPSPAVPIQCPQTQAVSTSSTVMYGYSPPSGRRYSHQDELQNTHLQVRQHRLVVRSKYDTLGQTFVNIYPQLKARVFTLYTTL